MMDFLLTIFVYAQSQSGNSGGSVDLSEYVPVGLKINGEPASLLQILDYVSAGLASILGSAAVVSMMYGAYLYTVSAGNEELQNRGKIFLRYPILGLVIASFAYVIVRLIVQIILGEW